MLDACMSLPSPSRVVVSVAPRMLGDALSVALAQHDLQVTVLPHDPPPATPEHYDVAVITSDALPPDLVADVVIRIPDPADPHAVGTLADRGRSVTHITIRSLSDIVALVNRFVAGRRQPHGE